MGGLGYEQEYRRELVSVRFGEKTQKRPSRNPCRDAGMHFLFFEEFRGFGRQTPQSSFRSKQIHQCAWCEMCIISIDSSIGTHTTSSIKSHGWRSVISEGALGGLGVAAVNVAKPRGFILVEPTGAGGA